MGLCAAYCQIGHAASDPVHVYARYWWLCVVGDGVGYTSGRSLIVRCWRSPAREGQRIRGVEIADSPLWQWIETI